MGFTTYIRPVVTQPTVQEIIASLSGTQKLAILDAYAEDKKPDEIKHELPIPKSALVAMRDEMDAIQAECHALMREEILLEDEVLDPETGEVITPAIFNDAPVDIDELKSIVSTTFDEIFTVSQIGAFIDRMILHTEINSEGTYIGTWAVYAAEVVK